MVVFQKAGLHSESSNDDGRAFGNIKEFLAILLRSSSFLATFLNFQNLNQILRFRVSLFLTLSGDIGPLRDPSTTRWCSG